MGGMEIINIINTTLSERTLEREIQAAISGIMMREAVSANALEQEIGVGFSGITGGETEAGFEDKKAPAPNFFPQTSYSFHHQEFLAGLHYNAPVLDYEKLWYGENKSLPAAYDVEQDYATEMPVDTTSDMLTVQEAEETFMNIQYHALLGNVNEVNGEERRKFNLWIAFNPALFKLFESTRGLTREVNYGAV